MNIKRDDTNIGGNMNIIKILEKIVLKIERAILFKKISILERNIELLEQDAQGDHPVKYNLVDFDIDIEHMNRKLEEMEND